MIIMSEQWAGSVAEVMTRLKNIADAVGGMDDPDDEKLMESEAGRLLGEGWTPAEVVSVLRNTEHVNPKIPEATALARIKTIRAAVAARLAAAIPEHYIGTWPLDPRD